VAEITNEPIAAAKLLLSCKLVETGGEAKRIIKQGGAEIDGTRIDDPNKLITPADGTVIRVGKRRFAKLKVK
jgi:tyrosyl-tRNA synthetase